MKTLNLVLNFFLFFIIHNISINSAAQKSIELEKINTIINLSKFINWQTVYNNNSEKLIFVISDETHAINYEIQTKNTVKYKNWQVIVGKKYNKIVNGSIVFITNEQKLRTDDIIKISKIKNILTIADNIDDFCINGGMINIKNIYGKKEIEINYQEIQDRDIEISSKLLTLAKIL
ncbi:MAG: hypothetical protein B6I20_00680 [Bacteroidetes bacterium 4572_117]|nr:MAG: hypothetical protein B6I20_00680 [Bacteroidetes bacterium 4572_117]